MFYNLAKANYTDTKTLGLRKYYFAATDERLYDDGLLDRLRAIADLCGLINNATEIDGRSWAKSIEILRPLDILFSYPNDFWKYPVIIYYLRHRAKYNFEDIFARFLNKLAAALIMNYLLKRTMNATKSGILKLNAAIIKSATPAFEFGTSDIDSIPDGYIISPKNQIVRMLLKVLAYGNAQQIEPLPWGSGRNWEIEHILPKKWQAKYFPKELDAKMVEEMIEHLGNKLALEKKLNITASNGYFAKKQKVYKKSEIAITKELGIENKDWTPDNILERDKRVAEAIRGVLARWTAAYSERWINMPEDDMTAPRVHLMLVWPGPVRKTAQTHPSEPAIEKLHSLYGENLREIFILVPPEADGGEEFLQGEANYRYLSQHIAKDFPCVSVEGLGMPRVDELSADDSFVVAAIAGAIKQHILDLDGMYGSVVVHAALSGCTFAEYMMVQSILRLLQYGGVELGTLHCAEITSGGYAPPWMEPLFTLASGIDDLVRTGNARKLCGYFQDMRYLTLRTVLEARERVSTAINAGHSADIRLALSELDEAMSVWNREDGDSQEHCFCTLLELVYCQYDTLQLGELDDIDIIRHYIDTNQLQQAIRLSVEWLSQLQQETSQLVASSKDLTVEEIKERLLELLDMVAISGIARLKYREKN